MLLHCFDLSGLMANLAQVISTNAHPLVSETSGSKDYGDLLCIAGRVSDFGAHHDVARCQISHYYYSMNG